MSDPEAPRRGRKKPEQRPKPDRQLLEDLGRTVEPWVHAGVCEARDWRPGLMVTAEEYRAACAAWLGGRIDGQ
ncbi:MAG: hypothetical protein OXC31_26590 [Spirochaetaceae bacterium]|nr:hypothetical protein [Spirochaetaceae bacterium]